MVLRHEGEREEIPFSRKKLTWENSPIPINLLQCRKCLWKIMNNPIVELNSLTCPRPQEIIYMQSQTSNQTGAESATVCK